MSRRRLISQRTAITPTSTGIDAESGENACLTNSGRVKGFCWQGAETLLYTVPVEADDAFPDGQTVLYRQNAGSAAEEVCRGEGSLSLEGVLTDGSIVFSRVDNLTTEAALEGLAGHERARGASGGEGTQ